MLHNIVVLKKLHPVRVCSGYCDWGICIIMKKKKSKGH